MDSQAVLREESYEFFKDIKKYLSHNDNLNVAEKLDKHETACEFMSSDTMFTEKQRRSSLCERFNYLIELLTSGKSNQLRKCDKEYLNFWLNDELNTTDNNSPSRVNDFYEKLNREKTDSYINSLEGHIYNIAHEHFVNMSIINNLYKNYGKIFKEESNVVCGSKENCLEYSKICYNEYKKGLIRCFNKNGKWCEKLSEFKIMYETKNKKASLSNVFSYNDLIKLPKDEDVEYDLYGGLNSWKNLTMMIFSILGSMIGIFFYIYKFSPFGKKFCSKEKRKNKFRHNILMETHEFLHAYDNHNKNSNNTYNLHYKSVDFS